MPITSKTSLSKQFSTIIATGEISSNEIIDAFKSSYIKRSSNNILWDFRYADLKELLFSDVLENIITNFTKLNWELKGVGKTAIVASTDLWFSLARMHATFAETKDLLHKIQIFRFMDEAIKWLGSEK